MHLATKIHNRLDNFKDFDAFVAREVTHRQFKKAVNLFLRPYGAKAEIIKDTRLRGRSKKNIEISGYFTMDRTTTPIVLNFHFPAQAGTTVKFDAHTYDCFRFLLSQVLQHELVHKHQWAQSDKEGIIKTIKVYHSNKISEKRLAQIDYMSDVEEVDAYAHDIAMEILYRYPTVDPITVLKGIESRRLLYSYNMYKNAFKHTNWINLKKALLRRIYKWLPHVSIPARVSR